jgi:purine-binding chemotaxis protein CheW
VAEADTNNQHRTTHLMSDHTRSRQIVILSLAAEHYALPIEHVQEIIRYTQLRSVSAADASVSGVISLRGRIVLVCDLAARLALPCTPSEESKIVIIESDTVVAGVIVDDVDEVLTIEPIQLEAIAGPDGGLIDSIAKLEDRLVILLQPTVILNEPQREAAERPTEASPGPGRRLRLTLRRSARPPRPKGPLADGTDSH